MLYFAFDVHFHTKVIFVESFTELNDSGKTIIIYFILG